MKYVEDYIKQYGVVREGNILKVDQFLNHQMDIDFLNTIGKAFFERFKHEGVTKILTIEASGIGIACIAAQYFHVPVVFAKKTESKNLDGDLYIAPVESFTKKKQYNVQVGKNVLKQGERVLLIDDFLANGCALLGLLSIVKQAGATAVGAGIVIEKAFQDGGKRVRAEGLRVESLATIERMSEGEVFFAPDPWEEK